MAGDDDLTAGWVGDSRRPLRHPGRLRDTARVSDEVDRHRVIEVAGQLLRCVTQLEMGERVASFEVPLRMVVASAGQDRILTARGTGLGTRRGNGYWAEGTSWMRATDPDRGSEARTLELRSIGFDRGTDSTVTMRISVRVKAV